MIGRRQVVSGAAALALVGPARGAGQAMQTVYPAALETRLFNFRDAADPVVIAAIVAGMREK